MLRGNKSDSELRFELFTWGAMILAAAMVYAVVGNDKPVSGLVLFLPGMIMLGSALFQDMQSDWKSSWLTYVLATVMVATGLAGIVNGFFGERTLQWWLIAVVELGAILIVKAVYDPTPR